MSWRNPLEALYSIIFKSTTMPEKKEARPYQVAAAARAVQQNTIINLATGGGKTLIAVKVLDEFLTKSPDKKVLFLAPTKVLVKQQADYIREQAHVGCSVVEMMGMEVEKWTPDEWRNSFKVSNVFVGTPEVFRKAIVEMNVLDLKNFSLVIFDECHNATGNSPMALICKRGLYGMTDGERPRILGLTASFVNGRMDGVEKKRKLIEELLQSTIYTPAVTTMEQNEFSSRRNTTDEKDTIENSGPDPVNDMISQGFDSREKVQYRQVPYSRDDLGTAVIQKIEKEITDLLGKFDVFGIQIKHSHKIVKRAIHVYRELGDAGFRYYLSECLLPQLRRKAEMLAEMNIEGVSEQAREEANLLKDKFPEMQGEIRKSLRLLDDEVHLTQDQTSGKLHALRELLARETDLGPTNSTGSSKGIVFVTQISLTYPMKHLLERQPLNCHRVGCISGGDSMNEQEQKAVIEDFKNNKLDFLVATPVLQEGFDVPACNFVVYYEKIDTTKAFIQGSGRARVADARIYLFDNEVEPLQMKRRRMEEVAASHKYVTTKDELECARALSVKKCNVACHPWRYDPSCGEIDVFNCVKIVHEYTQKVLGQPLPEDIMYETETVVIRQFPPEQRTSLVSVMLPTKDGEKRVTREEVREHWGDVDIADVCDPEQYRKWSTADQQKRMFLFVAAIKLAKLGCLTNENVARPGLGERVREKCGPYPLESVIGIKNLFPESKPNESLFGLPKQDSSGSRTGSPRNAANAGAGGVSSGTGNTGSSSGCSNGTIGSSSVNDTGRSSATYCATSSGSNTVADSSATATSSTGGASSSTTTAPSSASKNFPAFDPAMNYKGKLQEHFQKMKRPIPLYDMDENAHLVGDKFRATVTVHLPPQPDDENAGKRVFEGDRKATKKAAEAHCAYIAWRELIISQPQ